MKSYKKIIFNQKYMIIYATQRIELYDINKDIKNNYINFFEFPDYIMDINFNPILNNIFIVSFNKGYCKIYEIYEKEIQEKINFEGINEKAIVESKFSYLNPNIIASLNDFYKIIIWDVRDIKYINIINNKEEKDKKEDAKEKEQEAKEEKEQEEKEEEQEEQEEKEEEQEEQEEQEGNKEKANKEEVEIINFKWNRLFKDSLEMKTKK